VKILGLLALLGLTASLLVGWIIYRSQQNPESAKIDYNVDQGPFFSAPASTLMEVERTGPGLPKIDEIEIDLLDDISSTRKGAIGVMLGCPIIASKTVNGREARDIVECWRELPRSIYLSDLCHQPPYGLRFRYRGKVLMETTICWNCHNYDWITSNGQPAEWGFDADSETAKRLLELLKSQVPLPTKPGK
jgi:hypothetical protein